MSLAPFPAQLGPLTVRTPLVRTESTKSGLGNEPTRKEQAAVQVALIPAHLPIFQLLAGMHPSFSHKVPRNDSGRLPKSPRTPWLQLQLLRKQIAITGCIPINRSVIIIGQKIDICTCTLQWFTDPYGISSSVC